jgi:hypothetical protein
VADFAGFDAESLRFSGAKVGYKTKEAVEDYEARVVGANCWDEGFGQNGFQGG